jgi:hypothetical protein
LLDGVLAEAARQGKMDLSLVSKEVMDALEEAAAEQERARQKGAARQNRTDRTQATAPSGKSAGTSGDGANSA